MDTGKIFENVQRKHRQGRGVNTHSRDQARSILESTREEDEAEEPTHVFDQSDNGKWLREEAVVDSGAVECVTSKKRMPHLRAEETPESRRGETCTCAGGNEIKKEGKVTVNWRTDLGTIKRGIFKVGLVSRTLISVDRLQETGHDVIFTKDKTTHRQLEDRRGHAAEDRRRHAHSRCVDLGADESHEDRRLLGFCTAEVSLHSEDLVSPCSDLAGKWVAGGGCKDIYESR